MPLDAMSLERPANLGFLDIRICHIHSASYSNIEYIRILHIFLIFPKFVVSGHQIDGSELVMTTSTGSSERKVA